MSQMLFFCGKHGYSYSHSVQPIEVVGTPEMPDGSAYFRVECLNI